jgi:hypothetical protein
MYMPQSPGVFFVKIRGYPDDAAVASTYAAKCAVSFNN